MKIRQEATYAGDEIDEIARRAEAERLQFRRRAHAEIADERVREIRVVLD